MWGLWGAWPDLDGNVCVCGIRLPNDADSEGIQASFENGVLSIELAKRQPASKKTVDIA